MFFTPPPFPTFCLFTILSIHLPPYLPCSVFPVCGLLIRSYLPFTPLIYLVRYFPVCGLLLLPLFTLYNISQSVICCHVLIYHPVQSHLFTFLSFVVTFLFTLSPSTSILATGRRRRQKIEFHSARIAFSKGKSIENSAKTPNFRLRRYLIKISDF